MSKMTGTISLSIFEQNVKHITSSFYTNPPIGSPYVFLKTR